MRTQGFHTRLMLAIAAALGVLLTLQRPWYAKAPKTHPDEINGLGDINGPLNDLLHGMQRWVTGDGGSSGWDALGQWGVALAAMAGVACLGAGLCLAPAVQALGRDLLRYGSLAAFLLTLWKLLDPPGANAQYELRHGALMAAGFALLLVISAMGAAAAPLRKHVARASYQAPPPPVRGGRAQP
jgi:hypothetical protein